MILSVGTEYKFWREKALSSPCSASKGCFDSISRAWVMWSLYWVSYAEITLGFVCNAQHLFICTVLHSHGMQQNSSKLVGIYAPAYPEAGQLSSPGSYILNLYSIVEYIISLLMWSKWEDNLAIGSGSYGCPALSEHDTQAFITGPTPKTTHSSSACAHWCCGSFTGSAEEDLGQVSTEKQLASVAALLGNIHSAWAI